MKKIVFMLPVLCPGGAERVLITLMNGLDRSKFEPHLIALQDGEARNWISEGTPVTVLNTKKVTKSLFPVRAKLKEIQPDVVVSTLVHINALALMLKPLFPKTHFIVRESSLPQAIVNQYGWKGRLCRYIYKILYPHADLVISPADVIIQEFRTYYGLNTDNHKRLFNPVDTEKIKNKVSESFEDVDAETLRLVCAGRLAFEKGFDRLIEALGLNQLSGAWRLDILGDGSEREKLEGLIAAYKLEDNVFLQGYQDNPWDWIAKADACLLPSLWEGMPNIALESLACGTKVIGTKDAGGIVEIQACAPEGAVEVADDMKGLVAQVKTLKPAGKKQRAASLLPDEFSIANITQQFEDILSGS